MIGFKNKKIMVIVAHPDDELLGLGGTINKLCSEHNCTVKTIILGEGLTSRTETRDLEKWEKELSVHRNNIYNAQKKIGYQELAIYNLPDNRFDSVALLDIVKIIEKEKEMFLPEIIFTHHGGDTNIDHRRTFEAVITATRPLPNENVKTIISFETPSSTEWQAFNYPNQFLPNLFLEISEANLDAKIQGMECYEYESREYPHPRSKESLKIFSQRWGSVIGKKYAEAFMLIRHIS
jgi:LmbE family N-acetylglucosaminyl deacetylase